MKPKTVNTDGWKATMAAWKNIFCNILIIQCFLHAFLKIRDRCKKWDEQFTEISQKVWHVYRADTKKVFSQRIRRLREWSLSNLPQGVVLDKILALCSKSTSFQETYDHPHAHRTSNMIDRLMKQQDHYLFNMQYFHGNFISAELNVRAWAHKRIILDLIVRELLTRKAYWIVPQLGLMASGTPIIGWKIC